MITVRCVLRFGEARPLDSIGSAELQSPRMREITMSIEEQPRMMVLTRVVAGALSMAEAATLLGLSSDRSGV